MSYFAVIRQAGPAWIEGSSIEPWNLFVEAARLAAARHAKI